MSRNSMAPPRAKRRNADRIGRRFLVLAAVLLLVVQAVGAYIDLRREVADVRRFGESVVESAAVATSTPLWLMSGKSLGDVLRSYVSHASVDRVIIYEREDPWLAYDRDQGLIGDVSGNTGAFEEIDLSVFDGRDPFDRLRRPVVFDGETIGEVEIVINDGRVAAARRRALLQTGILVVAEIIIILAIMRLRGNQILNESLARVNESLRRFVPSQFLSFLHKEDITDIELGDHSEQKMAVVFLDIRSFTALSENLSPEENFDFINSFLSRMGPVVRRHGGFVDKYVGDGLMALFPNSVNEAVTAAVDLRRELRAYNQERSEEGRAPIDFGIGIHVGDLMLGTIGESVRMDSTVISSVVNLASRMEGLTKEFGVGIVVTESVAEQVGKETWEMRYLGRVPVKGATHPVDVYDVFEGEDSEKRDQRSRSKPSFESGARAAVEGRYAEAIRHFRDALRDCPEDPALDYYMKMIGAA